MIREAEALAAEHEAHAQQQPASEEMAAPKPGLWELDQIDAWPPQSVRAWYLQRLRHALPPLPRELDDTDKEYVQILRRRTWEVWDSYVPRDAEHQRRTTHAQQHVFRIWHREDRFDIRPHEEDPGHTRVNADLTFRRSQAALVQLSMQRAALDWDASRYAHIVALRARNSLALGSLQFRLFLGAGRAHRDSTGALKPVEAKPALHDYIFDATPAVASLHMLSKDVRELNDDQVIEAYFKAREVMRDRLHRYGHLDARIILISDQSVHLATHKHRRYAVRARATANLKESSDAVAPVFRAYGFRDGAMAAAHERNLEVATAVGADGYDFVRSARERRSSHTQERDLLEAEQQVLLQLTGLFTIRLEDALEHSTPSTRTDRWSQPVAIANASATLRWSEWLVMVTNELENEGHLSQPRRQHQHLGEPTWLASARLYRHRALCAATTIALTYRIPFDSGAAPSDELRQLSIDELRKAYLSLVSLPSMTPDVMNKVQQSALWHSFLDGATIPNAIDIVGDPLRKSDHLLAVHDNGGVPETVDFSVKNQSITVASGLLSRAGWDFGVIGRIPLGSAAANALDRTSLGNFSAWRKERHVAAALNAPI